MDDSEHRLLTQNIVLWILSQLCELFRPSGKLYERKRYFKTCILITYLKGKIAPFFRLCFRLKLCETSSGLTSCYHFSHSRGTFTSSRLVASWKIDLFSIWAFFPLNVGHVIFREPFFFVIFSWNWYTRNLQETNNSLETSRRKKNEMYKR